MTGDSYAFLGTPRAAIPALREENRGSRVPIWE
jgi:hypothetical protein